MNKSIETWQRTGIVPYHTEDYIPFHADYEYLRWAEIMLAQTEKAGRTETSVLEFFGTPQMEFDLRESFPLLTTKDVHFHSVNVELLWFLTGSTNIEYLNKHKVKIWNEWANEQGDVGPMYGAQWTRWNTPGGLTINQIQNLIDEIKRAPHSKGMTVTAWNPPDLGFDKVKIRPCHILFQTNVSPDGYLNLKMYQRSADWFLGVPFNIASYAELVYMLAQVTGYKPGRLILTFGSAHIYANHIEQMRIQLTRKPRSLPRIELNPDIKDIFAFKPEDIILKDYDPHPKLTGAITV